MTENEKVLHDARIHWIVFVPPVFYGIIALLVAIFFHPLLGGVILFLNIYPTYNAFIHYYMTHLILTNKKVMSRAGFLTRDWMRMNFAKIENAYLLEPIIGRSVGYSTVTISGIGSGEIIVPYVKDGDMFVKHLEQQLELNRKNIEG